MSAESSINPCIKATLGPTFAIWEGCGNFLFFGPFSIREKYAEEAPHVSPGSKMDPQKVPIWSCNYGKVVPQRVRFGRRLGTLSKTNLLVRCPPLLSPPDLIFSDFRHPF